MPVAAHLPVIRRSEETRMVHGSQRRLTLHHDNTIKRQAFNRTIASHRRKIFWDLNPEHPKAAIYVNYIDKVRRESRKRNLKGRLQLRPYDVVWTISTYQRRQEGEIISQYDPDSIWYTRIFCKRSIADGLILLKLVTSIAARTADSGSRKRSHRQWLRRAK